jgi:hypothetical protein
MSEQQQAADLWTRMRELARAIRNGAADQAAHLWAPVRQSIREIEILARAEMESSKLPGHQFGPADAYRHMIGVAEMRRRFGRVPAGTIAEANEIWARCCPAGVSLRASPWPLR